MSNGGLPAVLFIDIEHKHTYKSIQGVKTFICLCFVQPQMLL